MIACSLLKAKIKDVIDIKGGFVSIAKSTSLVTEKKILQFSLKAMSTFQDIIKGEKPILVDFFDWCTL